MPERKTDLEIEFLHIRLCSPLVLASGILGLSSSSLKRVADAGAGAVTTKSCGLEPRAGHVGPSIIPVSHGLLNAVGLSNPGVKEMVREIAEYRARCQRPIFASIFGRTVEEFGDVAEAVAQAEPDLIELNVSCPNVHSEFGSPFGADIDATAAITRRVKQRVGTIPISVKLTANCLSIGQTAKVCEQEGADALTAINTIGPGMLIDLNVRKPVLSNLCGGLSGPAILPVAVRAVWEISREVSIPIIGTGGVTTAEDALQMILAGATAVAIGSGIYYQGLEIFDKINKGLQCFLQEKGLGSLDEIRGTAHG